MRKVRPERLMPLIAPTINPAANDLAGIYENFRHLYVGGMVDQRSIEMSDGVAAVQALAPLRVTDAGLMLDTDGEAWALIINKYFEMLWPEAAKGDVLYYNDEWLLRNIGNEDDVLTVDANDLPVWTARAHNLLDGDFHPDTLTGTVARGDVIVGNATPKWSRLVKGSTGQYFKMLDANDPGWGGLAAADVGGIDKYANKWVEVEFGAGKGGTITTITLGAGGANYSVNDVLTITQAGSDGSGTATVTAVDGAGAVTAITLLAAGDGYQIESGLATTVAPAGGDNNCTINITAVNGGSAVLDSDDWRGLQVKVGVMHFTGTVATSLLKDWVMLDVVSGGVGKNKAEADAPDNQYAFWSTPFYGGRINVKIDCADSGKLKLWIEGNIGGASSADNVQVRVWAQGTESKTTNDLTVT